MTVPIVSVITPTKDRIALLQEAMDSVVVQTFGDWEHLVIDDGSTDGTTGMVAERTSTDPRIRLFKRKGDARGASVCRNLGLHEARGRYVVFLDSDDILEPGCLERRVAIMDRNSDLCFATFCSAAFVKQRDDVEGGGYSRDLQGDDLLRFLYFENPWVITSPIWRRRTLVELGGFDEALPSWQDLDLHIRAITRGLRYLRYPEVDNLVRWQFEETKVSVEQRRSPRHLFAAQRLLAKFEQLIEEGPGMSWVRRRALGGLYFFLAEHWIYAGQRSNALMVWGESRRRGLIPLGVHLTGGLLLMMLSVGGQAAEAAKRIIHKWRGWTRMRTNPELI